jgi:hypothetical protein
VIKDNGRVEQGSWPSGLLISDGVLESLVWFRPDLVDISRATLGQFRMIRRIPRPGGKPQGFALLMASYVPPEDLESISATRLLFGSGSPVEFVAKFLRYLDDTWHGFLRQVP